MPSTCHSIHLYTIQVIRDQASDCMTVPDTANMINKLTWLDEIKGAGCDGGDTPSSTVASPISAIILESRTSGFSENHVDRVSSLSPSHSCCGRADTVTMADTEIRNTKRIAQILALPSDAFRVIRITALHTMRLVSAFPICPTSFSPAAFEQASEYKLDQLFGGGQGSRESRKAKHLSQESYGSENDR